MINKILEKFDEQFGKDGIDKNSDSIGRSAGCDDCSVNIKLRAEHKDFLRQSIVEVLEDVKRKIKSFKIMDGSVIDKLDEDTERARITNNLNENLEIGYRQACLDILSTITSEIESNK